MEAGKQGDDHYVRNMLAKILSVLDTTMWHHAHTILATVAVAAPPMPASQFRPVASLPDDVHCMSGYLSRWRIDSLSALNLPPVGQATGCGSGRPSLWLNLMRFEWPRGSALHPWPYVCSEIVSTNVRDGYSATSSASMQRLLLERDSVGQLSIRRRGGVKSGGVAPRADQIPARLALQRYTSPSAIDQPRSDGTDVAAGYRSPLLLQMARQDTSAKLLYVFGYHANLLDNAQLWVLIPSPPLRRVLETGAYRAGDVETTVAYRPSEALPSPTAHPVERFPAH
ncbi:hypothetical protein HWV62_6325 [Athelia sp. TMB]|nr:hypothetical protein HWV62_6325 [Athelia sp. TMB]